MEKRQAILDSQQPDNELEELQDIIRTLTIQVCTQSYMEGKVASDLYEFEYEAEKSLLAWRDKGSEKGRYCGVCFNPCYENGGWKCDEHGYKSVYISSREARELRLQSVDTARIDELSEIPYEYLTVEGINYRSGRKARLAQLKGGSNE